MDNTGQPRHRAGFRDGLTERAGTLPHVFEILLALSFGGPLNLQAGFSWQPALAAPVLTPADPRGSHSELLHLRVLVQSPEGLPAWSSSGHMTMWLEG